MSANKSYKESIKCLNNRLDKIISLVDNKKHFYNNVFFSERDKEIPICDRHEDGA